MFIMTSDARRGFLMPARKPRKPAARKSAKPKPPFLERVEGQLSSLPGFRSRAMFGGFGLFVNDQIFACVDQDRLYFRVNSETRPDYEAEGMSPFEYAPGQVMASYYEVPKRVQRDDVLLREWAMNAVQSRSRK
jgi:DNA transformation protein